MDLSTTYLGLKLKNPIVPSSSPLSRHVSTLRRMEDAGAAAVVLYSLFEEIGWRARPEQYLARHRDLSESITFFPKAQLPDDRPGRHLNHIARKRKLDVRSSPA